MTDGPGTGPEDTAFAASLSERDRTLAAMARLESSLAMAAGAGGWLEAVGTDLNALENALLDEQRESSRPDALLSMIGEENQRWFGSRVRQLREQLDDLIRQVGSIRRQLEDPAEGGPDASDVRQRLGWVIRALRHHRARQTDLVYEAIERDLGAR